MIMNNNILLAYYWEKIHKFVINDKKLNYLNPKNFCVKGKAIKGFFIYVLFVYKLVKKS